MTGGLARPGRLQPGQRLAVQLLGVLGEREDITGVLIAVLGQPGYGRPLGLVLDQGAGKVRAIAGVLDSVPERTGGVDGRVLVLRLTDVRNVEA